MLYEIAHVLKDKFGFLWKAVEFENETFTIRMTEEIDAPKLAKFFREQPEDAYKFFKPHGFDEKSLRKVLRNKSFLTFVVVEGDEIVGYFFLRSFVNGKCFKAS